MERLGLIILVRNLFKRENFVYKVGVEELLLIIMLVFRYKVEVGFEVNYFFLLKIKY